MVKKMNPLMEESISYGKKILVVNNDPEVLAILEKRLFDTYPNCKVEKATGNQEAMERLGSWAYDLVILDITQVWSSHILNHALRRNFPVVVFKSLLESQKLFNVSKE